MNIRTIFNEPEYVMGEITPGKTIMVKRTDGIAKTIIELDSAIPFDDLNDISSYIYGLWGNIDALEKEVLRGEFDPDSIKRVQFDTENNATIVFFNDGSKSVVVARNGDEFNKETGLAMAILKHICPSVKSFNKMFKKWC